MPWLIATYQATGLFSLKHGEATSTGAKTLIIPTPFAVRTALLDAALRVRGLTVAEEVFVVIKRLQLAIRPPRRIAVTNLFVKVLKPERDKERGRPFQKTIAFREYAHWEGPFTLALGGKPEDLRVVQPLLAHITYFGKRGSFVQLIQPPEQVDSLPEGFVRLEGEPLSEDTPATTPPGTFTLGLIQRVDEWGKTLTFAKVNVYTGEKIRLHRDRIRFDVVLPYRITQAGRGFTVYERAG